MKIQNFLIGAILVALISFILTTSPSFQTANMFNKIYATSDEDGGNDVEEDGGNDVEEDGGNIEDGGNDVEEDGGRCRRRWNDVEEDGGNDVEEDGGNDVEEDGGNDVEEDGGNDVEEDGGNDVEGINDNNSVEGTDFSNEDKIKEEEDNSNIPTLVDPFEVETFTKTPQSSLATTSQEKAIKSNPNLSLKDLISEEHRGDQIQPPAAEPFNSDIEGLKQGALSDAFNLDDLITKDLPQASHPLSNRNPVLVPGPTSLEENPELEECLTAHCDLPLYDDEICRNGIDDDGDGRVDEDPYCSDVPGKSAPAPDRNPILTPEQSTGPSPFGTK
ncbi:MAG: hypothetical protein MRJ93_03020 [Nitrososphaeraceae archaeon]|nr:hypothetical protein [Nitrososphaeraceae archaeon]